MRKKDNLFGNHSFSMYAKFSEEHTFITLCYAHIHVRIRGKNVSFSENFAYVPLQFSWGFPRTDKNTLKNPYIINKR